jgi:hypothetical protein
VNGDGYEDIFVYSTAAIFVFFGHADGPSTTPDIVLTETTSGHNLIPGGRIGDVNGDGYVDTVVVDSLSAAGYVYFGGPSGPSTTNRRLLNVPGVYLNTSIQGAGDVDGDGYPDFVLANPYVGPPDGGGPPGQAFVFRGQSTMGLVTPVATLTGESPNGAFGVAGAIVGDVNVDGFDDLVVGAWTDPASNDGRAYFYPGGPSGVSDSLRNQLVGRGSYFGTASAAGDVNGDGVLDVLVAGSSNGYIEVVFGAAGHPLVDTDGGSPLLFLDAVPFIRYLALAGRPEHRVRGG